MANSLIRAGAALGGATAGAMLSWAMLLLASHVDRSASISARCQDLVHCGASWPAAIALAAVLLLPAAALTLLNLVAWRRWRWRRWCAAALAVALSSSAFELRLLCC